MDKSKLSGLINVALLGVDTRSYKVLSAAFTKNFSGKCTLTTTDKADIFVINLDSKTHQEDYKNYKTNFQDKPLIGTSIQNQGLTEHVFLKKPINTDHLYYAIQALRSGESIALVNATLKDLVKTKIANRSKGNNTASALAGKFKTETKSHIKLVDSNSNLYFNPKQFFLSVIQEAVKNSCCNETIAHIKLLGSNNIIIDTKTGRVHHDCSRGTQRQMYLLDIEEENYKVSVQYLNKVPKLEGDNIVVLGLDTYLWDLALFTCKGRLPTGTDPEAYYYLMYWPNFTRLALTPNAMRMAAYWVRGPVKMKNMIEALRIEPSEVFSFYTACNALGLAGAAKRTSDTIVEAPRQYENDKRGLFKSLLKKLRIGKSDNDIDKQIGAL